MEMIVGVIAEMHRETRWHRQAADEWCELTGVSEKVMKTLVHAQKKDGGQEFELK